MTVQSVYAWICRAPWEIVRRNAYAVCRCVFCMCQQEGIPYDLGVFPTNKLPCFWLAYILCTSIRIKVSFQSSTMATVISLIYYRCTKYPKYCCMPWVFPRNIYSICRRDGGSEHARHHSVATFIFVFVFHICVLNSNAWRGLVYALVALATVNHRRRHTQRTHITLMSCAVRRIVFIDMAVANINSHCEYVRLIYKSDEFIGILWIPTIWFAETTKTILFLYVFVWLRTRMECLGCLECLGCGKLLSARIYMCVWEHLALWFSRRTFEIPNVCSCERW